MTAIAGSATRAETRWLLTDLGTLGGPSSFANAINNRGQVIGYSDTNTNCGRGYQCIEHAFLWERGEMIDVGDGYATAINDRGQIVVGGRIWEKGKTTARLRSLPNKKYCGGVDINERGEVVGSCKEQRGRFAEAVLWQKGKVVPLGTLGPSRRGRGFSEAVAINERGQVVGSYRTTQATMRGFLWEEGEMRDLGTLPGLNNCRPTAISDSGQILGYCYLRGRNRDRAFLWRDGEMSDLGGTSAPDFPDRWNPANLALNSRGDAVGPSEPRRSFLWRNGRRELLPFLARDLDEQGRIVGVSGSWEHASPRFRQGTSTTVLPVRPGSMAGEAVAMNDRGQIVGCSGPGDCATEKVHAVLWTLERG